MGKEFIKNKLFYLLGFTLFLGMSVNDLNAQSSKNYSKQLDLINEVEEYCQSELSIDLPNFFYKNWSKEESGSYYLYVSHPKRVESAFDNIDYLFFEHDLEKAKEAQFKYSLQGYHTLLYETFGNTRTELSKQLLNYSNESIAFIAFHEATHLFIRSKATIPYILEEAICDLVANQSADRFAKESKLLSSRRTRLQREKREEIGKEINELLSNKELTTGPIELEVLLAHLNSKKEAFLIDRYNYTVNNAYLLRNRNYTAHYFKLKQLLELSKDLESFLSFVITLPTTEEESLSSVSGEISKNKNQPY